MRNTPLKGFASPLRDHEKDKKGNVILHQHDDKIDTDWADSIYTKQKVDESLTKSGHHTEGNIRGQKKSEYHKEGLGDLGGTEFLG